MDRPYRRGPPDANPHRLDAKIVRLLWNKYSKRCVRYLRSIGATDEEAEELWAGALEKLWESPSPDWQDAEQRRTWLKDPEKLRNWLHLILRHDLVDLRRKQKREQPQTVSLDELFHYGDEEDNPESGDRRLFQGTHGGIFSSQDMERRFLVEDTLKEVGDRLSSEELEVFILNADGMNLKEIAMFLGEKDATIRKRVSRAQKKLAERCIYPPRPRW